MIFYKFNPIIEKFTCQIFDFKVQNFHIVIFFDVHIKTYQNISNYAQKKQANTPPIFEPPKITTRTPTGSIFVFTSRKTKPKQTSHQTAFLCSLVACSNFYGVCLLPQKHLLFYGHPIFQYFLQNFLKKRHFFFIQGYFHLFEIAIFTM